MPARATSQLPRRPPPERAATTLRPQTTSVFAVRPRREADLEDEGQGVANMFMASQAVSKTGQKQHSFFRTRKIRVVELAVGAAA